MGISDLEPVVKLIEGKYTEDESIKRLLKYIAGKGSNAKTERVLSLGARGLKADPKKAAKQIITLQRAIGRDNERRAYHFIVSFPVGTPMSIVIQAEEAIAEFIFEHHQVFYAIHSSKSNLHIHLAINAWDYREGRKWHKNKLEFAEFIERIYWIAMDAMNGRIGT